LVNSIFFPASYDQTSPQTLPTVFTIHGGGFCLGTPEDDDEWNRAFADLHNVLVVGLNYSKAPWFPFPTGLHDVEALFLAAVEDESLPLDASRVAVLGFSAGGNLALAMCQLPSVRRHARAAPRAVVPVYAPLDFTITPYAKRLGRPYKVGSGLTGIRGEKRDYIMDFADVFDWAYIPYGADLRNPLVCPAFARRDDLPSYVFVIAAELDFLAFEELNFACKLAGRDNPLTMVGRQQPAKTQELELDDERFHWESKETRVKWLLVPDVIHAFDLHPVGKMASDPETARDGDAKALKYIKVLGEWLHGTVWR
jgi:acetyl esterase/lipase